VLAGLGLAGCHTAGRGDVRENHKDNLLYVFIPSGTFEMGCSKLDEDCKPDEKPAHTVTISKGFWIGQTEVTVEAYRRFATTTHRPMPPEPEFGSRSLNPGWSDPGSLSSMSTGMMPVPTANGLEATCRPKRNGSTPRAEARQRRAMGICQRLPGSAIMPVSNVSTLPSYSRRMGRVTLGICR